MDFVIWIFCSEPVFERVEVVLEGSYLAHPTNDFAPVRLGYFKAGNDGEDGGGDDQRAAEVGADGG